jgi:nucleotide-binding universal stress UspA family protein
LTAEPLRLGVIGSSSKENEHRLPLHPGHLDRIPAELRQRITLEHGYGARFRVSDSELAESVAGFAEKYPDVEVTQELSRGLVDDCLVDHAPDAGLVVVGRSPASVWSRFLHASCALAVLERAHTAVAVVPESA